MNSMIFYEYDKYLIFGKALLFGKNRFRKINFLFSLINLTFAFGKK